MTITIGEDDGFLFSGKPRLVVVSVCFDDGRSVRFPYPADKPINALYEDLNRLSPQAIIPNGLAEIVPSAPSRPQIAPVIESLPQPLSSEIGKGDIVECIHLENRNDHAGKPGDEMLFVGSKYRVHKVVKGGYQVIDDNAPVKFILFLMNHEVKLFKKGKPIEKKKLFLEEGLNCPKCTQLVYCGLHDGYYVGKCECGQEIRVSRQEVKGGQASVGVVAPVQPATAGGALQEDV